MNVATLRLQAAVALVMCMAIPCMVGATGGKAVAVSQHQYQVPVLLQKQNNPVTRLAIGVPADGGAHMLEAIVISLAGSSDSKDIKRVSLYAAGRDSAFTSLFTTDKLQHFGTAEAKGQEVVIRGRLPLSAGTQYAWVSLELQDKAGLQHFIKVKVLSVRIDGAAVPAAPYTPLALRTGVALRQHNQDGVHTYRIPGLATANDGSLLAIYDVRRESARDLQGPIDIGLNRSVDKGKTWLPLQIVLDRGTWGGLPEKFNGISDACILVDKRTGHIYIAGLWMHGVLDAQGKWIEGLNEDSTAWNHQWRDKGSQPGWDPKQTAQFLLVKSEDNGSTWSQPVNLTTQCKKEDWWLWAPAPGAGITLADGTLVFPTQGRDRTGKAFSNITYSKDGGKTWTTSQPGSAASTTENMAVELSDGSILLNMRSNRNRTDTGSTNGREIAVTRDLGHSWVVHPSSRGGLIEPTCMASIIRHDYTAGGQKKSVLLFSNPDSKTLRHRMTIKVSYDDGLTWSGAKKILLDEGKSRGYSCLTSIDNDTIGIVYESSMADMVFQQINLKELL